MLRDDLLALDDDALVLLANRGLVKRARREIDKGGGPSLDEHADGTVVATATDGSRSVLPPGVPLRDAECACGATRMCRHRVAAVLAYRALHVGAKIAVELPPLELDDEALAARLGASAMVAATRHLAGGYSARVRLAPPPVVLLPTCTVTFLAPWALEHARCDCVSAVMCEHVAMAVWAVRAAEPGGADEQVIALGGGDGRATGAGRGPSLAASGAAVGRLVGGARGHRAADDCAANGTRSGAGALARRRARLPARGAAGARGGRRMGRHPPGIGAARRSLPARTRATDAGEPARPPPRGGADGRDRARPHRLSGLRV